MNEKLSLPSIKDLIEGGPGLIDYSSSRHHEQSKNQRDKSYLRRHRRHASEHIPSSTNYSRHNIMLSAPLPVPHPPQTLEPQKYTPPVDDKPLSITALDTTQQDTMRYNLPHEMQQLSLEKKIQSPSTTRIRTHSRSYSDFTHSYTKHQPVASSSKLSIESKSISSTTTTTATNTTTSNNSTTSLPVLLPNPITREEPPITATTITKVIPPSADQQQPQQQETTIANARYVCPYCKKGFSRPSSLRTHTYSHTGEKPFVCTEPCCGKKFSVQSNLRRHLRIHRLNKPTTLFLPKNIN